MKTTTEKPKAEGDCSPASCSRTCFNCEHYFYHATYKEDSCSLGVVKGRDSYLDGDGECPKFEGNSPANAKGDSQSPDQ